MANANAPLDLTGDQCDTVRKLALMMKGVAAVLLLLAGINVIGGVLTLVLVSPILGILAVVEGIITGLLGLIMLSSAADVRFMIETKYTSIHLGHAFQDLAVFYKCQFFLALFLILVWGIRLFTG